MEWSLNIKSEFFIELSLGWFTLPLVNVDNIPLLMNLSILVFIGLNMSSFRIGFSLDIQVLVLVINSIDVVSVKLPHLPPS